MVFKIIENYKKTGHDVVVIQDEYGRNSIGFGLIKAMLIRKHSKEIDDFIANRSKNKESEE